MITNRKTLIAEITALHKAVTGLSKDRYPITISFYDTIIERNIELLHEKWFSLSRRDLYKLLEEYPNARRPIKELLYLLLKEVNVIDTFTGLCGVISHMKKSFVISSEERDILLDYIYERRPIGLNNDQSAGYWWNMGDRAPRLYFVNDLILELS